jgi:hypothetical protein
MSQVPAPASRPTPLTAEEQARAREMAYYLALKRGGGRLPPYSLNHANGDYWEAAGTIVAQRATSHLGPPTPVLDERGPAKEAARAGDVADSLPARPPLPYGLKELPPRPPLPPVIED